MSDQKLNLKFIHLANTAAASEGSYDKGAIIFEPKSGRIAVKGNSGLEYYGGNIKNATFEGKVLTLSFNKGEDIKLDFNDVASAEGMTTLLSGLRDKIDALRTDVTALQGASHTHANKAVLDGITDVKVAAWDAVADKKADYNTHITNDDIHVTAEQKTAWSGKQDALSTEQLAAANSGITATKVGTYDAHVGNTDIHVTTEDKAKWNAAEKNAKDYTNGKVGDIAEGTTVKKYVDDAKAAANKHTDDEVKKINTTTSGLRTDVDALKVTVGDAKSGLVKKVNDNAEAITALQGLHKDGVGGKMSVEQEVTAGVNAKAGSGITGTVQEYVDAGDAQALKDAKDYTNTKVETINSNAEALKGRVDTLEGTVGDHGTKLNTLIGSDADKSVRTIANEELVKQLIPSGAAESLDTLQEIAAWIQAHPGDASEMNKKIGDLEKVVGDASNGLVKDVATNTSNINDLKGLHDGSKTVATEVSEGIAGIAEKSASNVAGSDVVVTVTTEAGSVKTVSVDASVLRNDLGESNAEAGTGTAFARIKTLETTVGDSNSGLVKAVAGNTTAISNNAAAIKVLQDAQSSGSLTWFDWQD